MYEPEDQDEVQVWWEEQGRLPLLKRDWMWWIEVGLSNVVVAAICLTVVAFLLYGLVGAIGVLL